MYVHVSILGIFATISIVTRNVYYSGSLEGASACILIQISPYDRIDKTATRRKIPYRGISWGNRFFLNRYNPW
jgi:hypothetical protein